MSKLERTVKDLIIFYVKENYNNYLKENKIKRIEDSRLEGVISSLYTDRKEHLRGFIIKSMKEIMKDEYCGDLIVNNILIDVRVLFFKDLLDDLFFGFVLINIGLTTGGVIIIFLFFVIFLLSFLCFFFPFFFSNSEYFLDKRCCGFTLFFFNILILPLSIS